MGCFPPGEGRGLPGGCCELVALGTLKGGSGGDRKSFKVPSTVLGVAERDILMPAPASVITDGFGFPALQDAQWKVGIVSKRKKLCFAFYVCPVKAAAWLSSSRGLESCWDNGKGLCLHHCSAKFWVNLLLLDWPCPWGNLESPRKALSQGIKHSGCRQRNSN